METSWPRCSSKSPPPRGHYKSSVYSRRPNDFIVDQPLDVLQHRISVMAGFSECGIGLGSKQDSIRAIDADEPQLAQGVSNGVRVLANVGRKGHFRIACPLTNSHDAGCRIAVKNRAVLGKGDLASGVFRRLPIRVVGAAFDIVDRLAIEDNPTNQELDASTRCRLWGDRRNRAT